MSTLGRMPADADRRPIAARSWRASQVAADWRVRRGVSANGAGAGQDFVGPFAKQQRMACVIGCAVYCGLAPADWLPAVGLPAIVLGIVAVGAALTAVRRLVRIARRMRGAAS